MYAYLYTFYLTFINTISRFAIYAKELTRNLKRNVISFRRGREMFAIEGDAMLILPEARGLPGSFREAAGNQLVD